MRKPTNDQAKDLSSALAEFQGFAGLKSTGIYDEETAAAMTKPRCGVPDKRSDSRKISANFTSEGSKWNKIALAYRFSNFTPDITPAQVRATIAGAFARWSAITPLTFSETTSGEDITISFLSGDHEDSNPFDGPGSGGLNVWAHAFYPDMSLSEDVHFDEYENWSEYFLSYVALHEIGHSLGLEHSPLFDAVMYFDGGAARTELHPDDMAGIHSIYGWRDPRWQELDNNPASSTIIATGNALYQMHNDGQVWRYVGTSFAGWQLNDNQRHATRKYSRFPNYLLINGLILSILEIVADLNGQLYQRRNDGGILGYNGKPMDWSLIDLNPDCIDIAAGDYQLYQRHKEGSIYRYAGVGITPQWELIDDKSRTVQITAAQNVFQRHNNGDLWRYIGPGIKWELIENNSAAGTIVAANDKLYQ